MPWVLFWQITILVLLSTFCAAFLISMSRDSGKKDKGDKG